MILELAYKRNFTGYQEKLVSLARPVLHAGRDFPTDFPLPRCTQLPPALGSASLPKNSPFAALREASFSSRPGKAGSFPNSSQRRLPPVSASRSPFGRIPFSFSRMTNASGGEAMAAAVVVVTGVTRGLGRALALELAKRGCTVAGCGRNEEQLKSLSTEMASDKHLLLKVDIASDPEVKKFAEEVHEKLGTPKIVEEFDSVMAINVNGTTNVIRHFVPQLLKSRTGIIVNFSSGWGRSTAAEVAPYCASKWAIEGLTKALSKELPNGIAAVSLNPGVVDTDMLRSCFGASASLHGTPTEWYATGAPSTSQ